MATTADMMPVFHSIEAELKKQTDALTAFVQGQEEATKDAKRAANLARGSAASSAKGSGSKTGGGVLSGTGDVLGGIGGLIGGVGKGVGFAGLGIGAALLGFSQVMDQFDPDKVKEGVETLLSIGEGYESNVEFLKEGGSLGIALTGIGAGLAIFSVGQGANALVNWLDQRENWTQDVKDDVETLLSIPDLPGADGANVAAFTLTLSSLGLALAAFGIGQTATAAGTAIQKFIGNEDWPGEIKSNVETLLEIPDLKNATLGNLVAFPAIMASLGLGLIAFSAGQATAGLASIPTVATDSFAKFAGVDGGENWAGNVRDNVEKLLEIPALENATFKNTAAFPAIMAAIGLGLIAFSAGQATAGLASIPTTATDSFNRFTGQTEAGENWAEMIRKNVETLLLIPNMPGVGADTVKFTAVMAGIGAGLTAFAFGKVVEGGATALNEGVTYFTTKENLDFADRIKSEVETLLEIPNLPGVGADTAKFATVMGGIAVGLTAFSAGKLVEGGATAVQGMIDFFTGQDKGFAVRIKEEVTTLLSITNGQTDDGSTFSTAMGNIATGLLKFTGGEFGASLLNIGSNILGFLSGGESPIQKVMSIADSADQLDKGANALGSIADNLAKFKAIDFDGRKFNIRGFADDLKEAVPIIEGALMGQEAGLIFGNKVFGLGSEIMEPQYAQAATNIGILRTALGMGVGQQTGALQGAEATGNASQFIAPTTNNIDNSVTNVTNNYYTSTGTAPSLDPAL